MTDSNWTEVGDSYPSCQRIYVREGIVGPGGGVSLTPPLVLTETDPARITTTKGTIALEGFATPFSASTRMTMKSLTAGNEASVIRWFNSAGLQRYSMGNDASGNGNVNWWLFDAAAGIYPLYFPSGNAGDTTGSIRWRNGRIGYDTATEQMTRRVANVIRETFDPTQYTLNSGGTVSLAAATTLTVAAAGNVIVNSSAGSLSLTSAAGVTVAGAGLVSISTPTDVNVSGNASVTIASGAGTVDINGLGVVKLDSVAGTVIGGVVGHPVGFYGSVGVAKQVGVPVTAAGIHAALVALGLIDP